MAAVAIFVLGESSWLVDDWAGAAGVVRGLRLGGGNLGADCSEALAETATTEAAVGIRIVGTCFVLQSVWMAAACLSLRHGVSPEIEYRQRCGVEEPGFSLAAGEDCAGGDGGDNPAAIVPAQKVD